jgi:type I restriction enzyme S subunit
VPRSAWRLQTINEFCTVQGGIQKTPLRAPVRHHFPYLRVANVQRGRIDIAQLERYELAPDELDRWRLNAGDLLIVEGNGSESEIGRCAIWRGEVDDCVYQNHLMRVRPTGDDAVEYLALYLNSPVGTAHMRRLAITTSGLFNLSVGKIRSIPVELPPPAEQHRIVAKVTELLALCDQLKARIAAARAKHAQLAEALVAQAVAA